jgi:hypothetical protein
MGSSRGRVTVIRNILQRVGWCDKSNHNCAATGGGALKGEGAGWRRRVDCVRREEMIKRILGLEMEVAVKTNAKLKII